MIARGAGHRTVPNEDYEVRYWRLKFGVTPDDRKAAVARVGSSTKDVENELAS